VMVGRYEQPVVVPQVMHPTCRFQDVSSVHIGALLQGLLSARHALCEPLDNGTRTEHGQNTDTQSHQHLRNSVTFWSARLGSNPCFSHDHVFVLRYRLLQRGWR